MASDPKLSSADLGRISSVTVDHYDRRAEIFWRDTRDHDVSQNIQALLQAIVGTPPLRILDFGCGPGRDLKAFKNLGHEPVGLDGSARFAEMARNFAGCEVWHQDFLKLQLPAEYFDGIFANASLFHVPSQELPRVLRELWATLKPDGVLFSSNPRGDNQEGWNGERFGAYHDWQTWQTLVTGAGFRQIDRYYRPAGLPREQQPWIASVWRKPDEKKME